MTSSAARPPTVLVVDDNPDSRTVFRYMMEARGCPVTEAVDGAAGSHAGARCGCGRVTEFVSSF